MFKLLVLSCLLVSCLADPFDLSSRFRKSGREHRHPRGCADRAEGWRACARLNSSDTLAPHGRDCSLFFYCSGARPACRKCPAGLHFNPQLQVCDWPENANCARQPPRPHYNGTTPNPTTPDNDTAITVTDGLTPTEGITTIDGANTEDISTDAAADATTTEPSVFSWQNYIPWVRK